MSIEELAFKNYYELINIQKIDLLLIIEFLQKDRKQWINQFTQTHNENVEIQKENEQLKANYERLYNENCKLREEHNINDISLLDENQKLKDNWNKLKEYLINDINNRNGNRVVEYEKGGKIVEYEDSRKVIEIISPIYTLMEDKSKTMKEVLDKMQELEQGSDSDENI